MKIAVLTTRLFAEPASGGEIGTARLLSELARAGHQVVLIGRGALPPGGVAGLPPLQTHSVGPIVTPFDALAGPQKIAGLLTALLQGQASTVQRLAAGAVARQVQRLLQPMLGTLDALIADHLQVLPWLDRLRGPLPPLVVLMHNVESQHYEELAARAAAHGQRARRWVLQREARHLRALEGRALRRAQALACVSPRDAAHLAQTAEGRDSRVRLDVLPLYPLAPPPSRPTPRAERPPQRPRRIGLIGTWTWAPNRLALRWMLDCVRPHLPAGCVLVLAGTGLEDEALPPGVESHGRMAHVADFYADVDVVALSARAGSGVQEKAVEAIAMARLVVATPHSLRGLDDAWPPHVHVAEEPQAFARACAQAPLAEPIVWARGVEAWRRSRQHRYADVLARCLALAS